MSKFRLTTPIALIIFNRPDTTESVFNEIRKAKPPKLLIVADGPRQGRDNELEKCMAARTIVSHIDWPCEVFTNYSEVNLGCKKRVSSGLDWVFNNVEEAIILEDDCLPATTFFRYCQEMLEKYRNDERIMMITGGNYQFGRNRTKDSYYFSRYNHVWGWASWRRAWQYYDVDLKLWPQIREERWLLDILGDGDAANYWQRTLDAVSQGKIDTWDYQWTFACFINSGLTVTPNVNLISNIGFGGDGTHTTEVNRFANMPIGTLKFPLEHPRYMVKDLRADMFIQKNNYA